MTLVELPWENGASHGSSSVLLDHSLEASRGCAHGPVRALMTALLFDGVITCLNYAGLSGRGAKERFKEAVRWIMSPANDYVFSFENVCECLGISPDALRCGVINVCNSRSPKSKKSRRNF